MKRTIIAVAALFSGFTATADYTFDPPAPTSHTSVVLRVREYVYPAGCEPLLDTVIRVDRTIDVKWVSDDCIGIPFPTPWVDYVPLGVLEPGGYAVRLFRDGNLFETKTLVVTLGDPPLQLSPPYASIHGGTSIVLFEPDNHFVGSVITRVRVAGAEVATQPSPRGVSFVAPAHAAGAVDVAVDVERETTSETIMLPAALQYLDPAAPVNSSVFERVLLPIIYNGPGAFGSQWVTEGAIEANIASFEWFHDFERAACDDDCLRSQNHASGLMVSVPRQLSEHALFAPLRVRDVSRMNSSYGAEVPVVREHEFRDELVFANVPFDPRYRLMLRLYSMTGVTRYWTLASGTVRTSAQLNGPCTSASCASSLPAFAAVDLKLAFPHASGTATVRVEQPLDPKWGFITVTNNETQQVTVISPMR
ncbi:MAG TPA: hypothetical protein VEK79_24715 [Thermoanaerobaculia bacterium]|nr:hypothetical protein [Thermoanaerobaculia bacterium]